MSKLTRRFKPGCHGCLLRPSVICYASGRWVARSDLGLDSDLYAGCDYVTAPQEVPSIEGDVRDVKTGDLRGFEAVVHLAALSNDPLGNLDPELTDEINHRASRRLAALAREAGVRRFLFSSSCSSYGAAGDRPVSEAARLRPVTAYGRSKVSAERAIAPLSSDTFSPTFLRNATAYGFSPRMRFDLVLNNLVAWAASTGRILLKSDGSPWRPLVHVEDIARAFSVMLRAPRERVHNQAFNVGGDAGNHRIRDVAEMVRRAVAGSAVEYAPGAGPDLRCYRVDFSKIQAVFPDFRPRWDAERGVEEVVHAYVGHPVPPEAFEGPDYARIERIQALVRDGSLGRDLRWRRN